MLFNLLFFIITISVVVVFHELGHYFAARYYNVRVERFSLGFGKVLNGQFRPCLWVAM